jgi:hypothetical protein
MPTTIIWISTTSSVVVGRHYQHLFTKGGFGYFVIVILLLLLKANAIASSNNTMDNDDLHKSIYELGLMLIVELL